MKKLARNLLCGVATWPAEDESFRSICYDSKYMTHVSFDRRNKAYLYRGFVPGKPLSHLLSDALEKSMSVIRQDRH